MDIVGRWKACRIMSFGEEGPTKITIEELFALPAESRDEELLRMATSELDILADGTLCILMPIPPEAAEEAKAEGARLSDDGYLIADEFKLEKDGESYVCTSESLGEAGPMPITFEGDELVFMGGMLNYKKL